MRSSKSRSRSKSNRQRSVGNIINRVFDSSGPEGKVRGTPQQIIDKYLMLARDAQLSNDRVAEQNFLQHAEHYTRMLGEAQRELAREQAERQAEQQSRQNDRTDQPQQPRADRGERGDRPGDRGDRPQDRAGDRGAERGHDRADRGDRNGHDRRDLTRDMGELPMPVVAADDTGLVETPEAQIDRRRPQAQPTPEAPADAGNDEALSMLPAFLTGEDQPRAPRAPRSRAPRAPKVAAKDVAADAASEAVGEADQT